MATREQSGINGVVRLGTRAARWLGMTNSSLEPSGLPSITAEDLVTATGGCKHRKHCCHDRVSNTFNFYGAPPSAPSAEPSSMVTTDINISGYGLR